MTTVTTTAGNSTKHSGLARRRGSGLRILVWTVGILVFGVMLISIMLPSLCRSTETANRVKCASNLRQIGQAILLYSRDNGGQHPPSLAVVLATQDIGAEVMVCPSSSDERSSATDIAGMVAELQAAETKSHGHTHCLSYVYIGRGQDTATVTDMALVAYEPLENHSRDGTNVLFGDGHVEFVGKREWPKLAAEAGIKIPAAPTTRP